MNEPSGLIFSVSTEMAYFASYAILIVGVSLTVILAKRAARMNDLEEAKKKMDEKEREKTSYAGSDGAKVVPGNGDEENG
ncbi:MAG: hypothetical protein HQ504_06140 [Rhodospirillaceae bacterium]|nr:hypothetical protein [Rhodospirillaceae bacterium]